MRSHLPALVLFAVGLLAGCSTDSEAAAPAAATSPAAVAWVGPSGLEVESEQAARAALEAQRAEAERLAVEAAAQAAAEAAAAQKAADDAAAAQKAADDAAAAQAVIDAEGGCPPGWYFDDYLGCTNPESAGGNPQGGADDGYVSSDLEVRCSDGTATVEECFGPGSDLNGNGIADINE
jgi:membrane protein involved in colicin uptake